MDVVCFFLESPPSPVARAQAGNRSKLECATDGRAGGLGSRDVKRPPKGILNMLLPLPLPLPSILPFTQNFTLVGQHVEIVVRSTVIGDCIATYVTTRGSEGGGGEGCPAGCEETSVFLPRHFV